MNQNKGALHVNLGLGGLYYTATGYAELNFTQPLGIHAVVPFIRVGFGGYVSLGDEGSYVMPQLGLITGKRKHHFEVAVGTLAVLSGDIEGIIPLSANLGWRFQRPGHRFMMRAGIAPPKAIYFGIGYSF